MTATATQVATVAAATTVVPTAVTGTPRSSSSGKRIRRICSNADCNKVDAGGGFCVSHGGGKKCSYPGCKKGYQTGGFCRQHGGGARCSVDGCTKVDAGKGLCRAHGGGKRCQVVSCSKADVGGGFCTAHGGGRRCGEPGCTKIDQGGGKCRAHGGARRCRHDGCDQPARGAGALCSDHGGAQICATPNCRRLVKHKGGTRCGGCVRDERLNKSTHNAETVDGTPESATMAELPEMPEMAGAMPAFSALLSQAMATSTATRSLSFRHSLMGSQMDHFNAFVEAAEAAVETDAHTPTYDGYDGYRDQAHEQEQDDQDHQDDQNDQRESTGSASSSSGMASCIDNGCSKGFGGRCNCKAGCTCCSRARTAERASTTGDEVGSGSSSPLQLSSSSSSSFLSLQRIVLCVPAPSPRAIPMETVRAIVRATSGVRSVHARPSVNGDSHTNLVLRCDPAFDMRGLDTLLSALGFPYQMDEHQPTTVKWPLKEIVLKVQDMMCPGNCGRTVMNAMQQVASVHSANLMFDKRCVIARGEMSARELCDAIDATGFDAVVVAETVLPRRFKLRVQDFASVHLLGHRLRGLLLEVEGVEGVVLMVERAEVLVEATLRDASTLLRAANANGIGMVEIPEDTRTAMQSSSSIDPVTRHTAMAASGTNDDHVCDVTVCPHNGCEQYMVTVAHTAALAVGWAVPGCAMSWGGECTCGEACKCAGCPEHNPLS